MRPLILERKDNKDTLSSRFAASALILAASALTDATNRIAELEAKHN